MSERSERDPRTKLARGAQRADQEPRLLTAARIARGLLPGDRDRDADDSIRTAHSAMYSAYWSRLRPLPQAAELLRACRKAGLRVVLASSADPQEFEVLRAALDAEDAIDEATSSGDVSTSKPAPDLVQVALDKAGVAPQQAVFVGDTVWDVEACQRAGVPCLGLRSGGISRAELVDAGAVAVFADPADLLATTAGRLAEALPGQPDRDSALPRGRAQLVLELQREPLRALLAHTRHQRQRAHVVGRHGEASLR